ncbi:MAG TPA: YdeI/OmpD-associated family protein [Terriglobales bacterium]|nr:YdeI/OmpD-associated family protein [Terriglobales bacterium]
MKKLEFTVKLEGKEGSSVAWLNAPFDVVKLFGTRARVPVHGTINGFPFRSSLMPMGGCHGMAVNKTMRDGAGVEAGDMVSIVTKRDEAERIVEVPPLLKKELAKSKTAQANWQKLSFTNQKEIALSIREAKQEETRTRRLAKAMDILKTGKKWTG